MYINDAQRFSMIFDPDSPLMSDFYLVMPNIFGHLDPPSPMKITSLMDVPKGQDQKVL